MFQLTFRIWLPTAPKKVRTAAAKKRPRQLPLFPIIQRFFNWDRPAEAVYMPGELIERLSTLAKALLHAHRTKRSQRVTLTAGEVTLAEVVRLCVTDFEKHRMRANRPKRRHS